MTKGNGIQQSRKNEAQLIKETLRLGLKISDLLDQNDFQAVEIRRLTKEAEQTMEDFGKVCDGCCKATSKQEELTEQNEYLEAKLSRRDSLNGLLLAFITAYAIMYATGVLIIEWRG